MDFKKIICKKVDNKFAKEFMCLNHYSHSCNLAVISYAFYENENLVCMVVYGRPSARNLSNSIWEGGNDYNTLELIRLFSFDWCPNNIESYCISQSIKHLKRDLKEVKILVSYADSSAGHVGYIYQASNWMFIGIGAIEKKIFIDNIRQHRRSLYGKHKTSSIEVLRKIYGERLKVSEDRFTKNKYIYIVAQSKAEKKIIESKLKVVSLPYPKGDIKYYSNEKNNFGEL